MFGYTTYNAKVDDTVNVVDVMIDVSDDMRGLVETLNSLVYVTDQIDKSQAKLLGDAAHYISQALDEVTEKLEDALEEERLDAKQQQPEGKLPTGSKVTPEWIVDIQMKVCGVTAIIEMLVQTPTEQCNVQEAVIRELNNILELLDRVEQDIKTEINAATAD